jgi:hypothetical protein
MEPKITSDALYDVFRDTEDFLHHLDPKKYIPPFLTTTFNTMRKDAFKVLQEGCSNPEDKTQKERILLFVSKFEIEYVEILRAKLREQYIDYILQKKYEIPDEINMKEVEGYGAISELAQLAIAIAEWTLELEICAYTLEGLKLYGLIDAQEDKKEEEYFTVLKKEYNYKRKSTFVSTAEYLLRRILNFAFGKVGSMALAQGISKGGIQGNQIWNIILSIAMTSQVSWKAVAGSLNLPWLVGGLVCSHFFQMLNDYAVKKEVLSNVNHVQETFEANKLHLMNERKTILDLVERALNEEDSAKHKWELEVLAKTVSNMLEHPENHEDKKKDLHSTSQGDTDKMFKVKEEGDCVIVELKDFHEKIDDESGVIVVDW